MKDNTLIVASTSALVSVALFYALQKALPKKKYSIPSSLLHGDVPHSKELALALRLALQAGKNMVLHCDSKGTDAELSEKDLGINTKGQAEDFATAVDLYNEKIVTEAIRKFFPSHKIIGEESTGTGALPVLTNDPTWIIDPIDGTTNFASGLPLSCVSIGFCINKQAVMGVVYAPMTEEVYMSVRGHGAFRNGVRIRKEKDVKKLKDSVVNYEFGYARDQASIKRMTTAVENVLTNGCRTSRCLGSGVLDLCYVATGRLDAVYAGVANEGWKPWDYCAANVIVEESGAVMECLVDQKAGQRFDLYSKSIVCATTKELLEETRKVVLKGLK
jgi:fructose-1,6-bisphosphatase/inositol monophosphatase family enzyme